MSECVVRMEMPESCKKCKATLCLWTKDDCEIMDTIATVQDFRKENDNGFPDFCPIICQLPEWHGRLVDADKLADDMKARKAFFGRMSDPQCLVEDAHTIVPPRVRKERNMSELIKREDAIKATWQEPSYTDPINVLTEVRDRINEIPTASKWHRVEYEMPKDGEWVLIWGDGFHVPIQAFHESGCWLDDQFEKYTATHWMPLPEPPKEDA